MEVVGLILFQSREFTAVAPTTKENTSYFCFKYMVCHPKNVVIDDTQTIIPGFKGFFVVWRSLIVYCYLFSIIHMRIAGHKAVLV